MEQVKIKICGLSRPEDIAYVNEAKPDYAGFVINVPKSSRSVSPELARELISRLDPAIIPVGVFRNNPLEEILELSQAGIFRITQLHSHEDESFVRKLREVSGLPVIKAFNERTLDQAQESCADYILLDHAAGGTGKTFDWDRAKTVDRPFFLAGGIGPDNIPEAVRKLHPWAVDLSSKVETEGKKDREKILAAVRAVRMVK